MFRVIHEMEHKDGVFIYSPPPSSSSSLSSPNSAIKYENESTQSSSLGRISPVILFIIVTLAVVFFVSGLLHLLVRYLIKRPSSLPIHRSNNRHPETPHAFQRQLQHLFRLHDSGLDQASIDALPVFYYKDITGLKEPFDCAVCLCELSDHDKLRLLPRCSHAFHITCIDTWLLSNSTCPLCRGSLLNSALPTENPVFSFDVLREISYGFSREAENGFSCHQSPAITEETARPKRVFSVRLGKFRSTNEDRKERGAGEISSSNLDARRCYSMGTYQYVVGDSDLRVKLSHGSAGVSRDAKPVNEKEEHGNSLVDDETEGKKISRKSRGESFSVSKTWLWSKRSKLPSSSDTHMDIPSFLSYYKFSNET